MKVLITGGAGFIGSTTATALEHAGHQPIILDSLVTGPRAFVGSRPFYEADIADTEAVRRVLAEHPDIAATIHMAARVVVPDSVDDPATYYRENVSKSLELFATLASLGHDRVLFSSSASVYAAGAHTEVDETAPVDPSSPYARTKLMTEWVLRDLATAGAMRAVILRYFNPIGSAPGLTSGVHVRNPSHVLGQLLRTATGAQDAFTLTGTDYETRDGTGLRDYIHVWDLAQAHVKAVEHFDELIAGEDGRDVVLNVGTGRGVTVLELVRAFERVYGAPIDLVEAPRRPGDVAGAFANVDKIRSVLPWRAHLTLDDGIRSALAWFEQRHHVLGYP